MHSLRARAALRPSRREMSYKSFDALLYTCPLARTRQYTVLLTILTIILNYIKQWVYIFETVIVINKLNALDFGINRTLVENWHTMSHEPLDGQYFRYCTNINKYFCSLIIWRVLLFHLASVFKCSSQRWHSRRPSESILFACINLGNVSKRFALDHFFATFSSFFLMFHRRTMDHQYCAATPFQSGYIHVVFVHDWLFNLSVAIAADPLYCPN